MQAHTLVYGGQWQMSGDSLVVLLLLRQDLYYVALTVLRRQGWSGTHRELAPLWEINHTWPSFLF